jgi:hypothetical protein
MPLIYSVSFSTFLASTNHHIDIFGIKFSKEEASNLIVYCQLIGISFVWIMICIG